MAAAAPRTCLRALRCSYRRGTHLTTDATPNVQRYFSITVARRSNESNESNQKKWTRVSSYVEDLMEPAQEWDRSRGHYGTEPKIREEIGLIGEGEEQLGADPEFYGDDISALGHGELEQHRELRQYARLAAWQLPLLADLAKPFAPPNKEQILRFRYTTYMGEEHPAANKVVVEFCPDDIPNLTQVQKNKLIKICGPRYNPKSEIVKMSSENFDSQMQNKRYLIDLVNSVIVEAKDPSDTFEDVPFDFRHHKQKPRYEFPKEWLLTPWRKLELAESRNRAHKAELKVKCAQRLIDGKSIIQNALMGAEPEQVAVPEMMLAGMKPARRLR